MRLARRLAAHDAPGEIAVQRIEGVGEGAGGGIDVEQQGPAFVGGVRL